MLWLNLPVKHISKPCTPHRVNCVVVTQTDKAIKACAPSWAWGKRIRKDLAVQRVAEMSVLVLQTSRSLLNYAISPLTLQRVQDILSQCIANMCTAVTLPEISEQKIMLIRDEKLCQSERSWKQHETQRESSADLLQVPHAVAELMTGLTCYLSCSRWTLGNCYAVVCVDSLTFPSKAYLSLWKGTSSQVLCHYWFAGFFFRHFHKNLLN